MITTITLAAAVSAAAIAVPVTDGLKVHLRADTLQLDVGGRSRCGRTWRRIT